MTDQTKGLVSHILSLADTKRLLGIRYSDWLLGAPTVETGIAASSMAQAEWGHARLLYAMLKDHGLDPVDIEQNRAPEEYCNLGCLDDEVPDWAAFVATVVLVDGALEAALRSFQSGNYELAQNRIPKMLAEETYHRDFGAAWYRRLAKTTGEGRDLLTVATARLLPPTLAWVAPEDDTYKALVADGIVAPADQVRADFEAQVGPVLASAGFDISTTLADRGNWDEARRRGPGAPAFEAVERARGDRNRALFVE